MKRPDPVATGRAVIDARYPQAVQAWLGGSVYSGPVTETSDLDITVLLTETDVHRESLTCRGWPVELFVHTEASVRYFVQKDLARQRPTMARLVAHSIPLLPGEGGAEVRSYCSTVLAAGPPAPTETELALARYTLTDLLDDLDAGRSAPELDAVAAEAWRLGAELLLASERRWNGSGKWMLREIEALDAASGTGFASRFHQALVDAVTGRTDTLITLVDDVLDRVGGRLRDGFYLPAALPPDVLEPRVATDSA